MSEASTQKLLIAMACVFGVVVVLIGYGRQPDRRLERLPLGSSPATAARPTTPATTPGHRIAVPRATSKSHQSSAQWQSTPATAQPSASANFAPAKTMRAAQDSYYEQERSMPNYFSSSATLASRKISHAPDRHPFAQKSAQRNRQLPQPTKPSTVRARPVTEFHDLGNVGKAIASMPIVKPNSNAVPVAVDSRTPNPDLFTGGQQSARDRASVPTERGIIENHFANQLDKGKAIEEATVTAPSPQRVQQTGQSEVAKISAAETSPVRIDRGVRKVNWTEIDPKPNFDPMNHFRPLEQPILEQRRANPQVESAAHEQIKYGQSLARRRAYFAAREEIIRALLLVASSYNADSNSTAHPERLAQGLIAIDELGDFTKASGSMLQQKILSHKSHLLTPQNIANTSAMEAIGLYSSFAQSQIVQAIGSSAAGSEALHALGKLESMVPDADRNQIKTLVFYRAAIEINPSNAVCGNDLGVLLFNMGRLEEAEAVLLAAINSEQTHNSWNNLALVHRQHAASAGSKAERDRQLSLANLASQQADKFANHTATEQPNDNGLNSNQWATPNEFQDNAAFPNVVVQHAASRSPQNTHKSNASKSATLKQKMKDWF